MFETNCTPYPIWCQMNRRKHYWCVVLSCDIDSLSIIYSIHVLVSTKRYLSLCHMIITFLKRILSIKIGVINVQKTKLFISHIYLGKQDLTVVQRTCQHIASCVKVHTMYGILINRSILWDVNLQSTLQTFL